MIAIEACAPEITSQQVKESFSMAVDHSSREEPEDTEEHCGCVYEEEKELGHRSMENKASEQEHENGPEKLQRSAENLV